ncbi:MAG: NAD-dependent DNA ligase LigA, partial [Firmicutes bacterium]|nr:NAD-dependent DNA ligase LigA [Bacillota bacterium]
MVEKRKRINELIELLNEASRAYYQESREIMSNFEYDKLYDELEALEKETGIVMAQSPTRNVGYEVLSELPKEAHPSPMLSLDKTKEVGALQEWLADQQGVLSWKIDGLTVVLTYRDGQLFKAVTRGNGEIGEVVTANAKVFKNLPMEIPFKGELVLRGEACIKYSDFEKINETIEEADSKYKNPRNLCSGSVRQLNTEITAQRSVNFYAFTMVSAEGLDFELRTEQFEWMTAQGFEVVESKTVNSANVAEAVEWFAHHVESNDVPSDGLVLILNDIAYGASLGTTSKFPRDAIAFKWADEIKDTVLKEIEWSASRTGLINPVAIFEPVELEGTTVSRASVHNISIVKELQLGIGDTIQVYKANMIIPQIAENLTRSGNLEIPEVCPVCGETAIIKNETGVEVLFCTNSECPAKQIKSLTHFVSRNAM